MKSLNLTRDKLSAYTEAILVISTNLSMIGNLVEEVDETTVKLWAIHNKEESLVFNKGPANVYARVMPNVKEWYRCCFLNFILAYAEFVEEELGLESANKSMTASEGDNKYSRMDNDGTIAFLIKEENEAYDMYHRSLVKPEYLAASSGLSNEVLEVMRVRGQIDECSIIDQLRFVKTLATFVKLLLMRKNEWCLCSYESALAPAQDEADRSYRSGDIPSNILLSFQHPELRSSVTTYAQHRDQLTAEVIVNVLILKRVLFEEEGW